MTRPDPRQELGAELAAAAIGDAPAVAVVDRLLARALEAGASDLHVEPDADAWAIRLRLDGVLHLAGRLPRRLAPTLVARLKVLAGLPTYVVDVPQDGRIPRDRARAQSDLRLAVLPTVHGEKAVVRLFDPGAATLSLGELGLPDDAAQALERAVLAPRGVVVLSGPAGSGKSTTIHAALRLILERSGGARGVVGIEDPVERIVPGVTQTQVNPAAGFGYAEALRAFLRQDPEVIYVGEARDAATAGVVIEAGLTGHLVITTLHAGSCAQVLTRLLEMRLEPHLLTSALTALFAQRLVRRLCAACAVDGGAGRRRAVGCPACHGTGYRGRAPLVEHATLGPALRQAVLERQDEAALGEHLRAQGQQGLAERGLALAAAGATSVAELERVLGPL